EVGGLRAAVGQGGGVFFSGGSTNSPAARGGPPAPLFACLRFPLRATPPRDHHPRHICGYLWSATTLNPACLMLTRPHTRDRRTIGAGLCHFVMIKCLPQAQQRSCPCWFLLPQRSYQSSPAGQP